MRPIRVRRGGSAALDHIADLTEDEREPAAHHMNQFLGSLRVRLRFVSFARPQLPRPQLEHVGPGGSDQEGGRAALRAAPEEPRRARRQDFRRMLSSGLDQIGDRCAESRGDLAQGGDRRVGLTALDLHKHAFADAGQCGKPVERQPLVAAPLADAAGDDGD